MWAMVAKRGRYYLRTHWTRATVESDRVESNQVVHRCEGVEFAVSLAELMYVDRIVEQCSSRGRIMLLGR